MTVRSNRAAVMERIREGARAGLLAGAVHYRNEMIKALRGGYTTGAFYSGLQGVAGSPVVGEPISIGGFDWSVQVGTNVPYAKFWEVGHFNIFTRRFERVEKWRPTMLQEGGRIHERFRAVFRQVAGVDAPSAAGVSFA